MNPFLNKAFEQHYRASPLTLVDIGASGGIHPRWNPFKSHLRVVAFEPDEGAFSTLLGSTAGFQAFTCINSALHSTPGEIEFYVTRKQENSSILPPNTDVLADFPDPARFHVVESRKIQPTTLDTALRETHIEDVDFVKVDTQGSELFILQGAADVLRQSVFGVEVEVEFVDIYSGQPLFSDVDKYLRGLGFTLFDLRPIYWKRRVGASAGGRKGQIIFADALYLRRLDELFDAAACTASKVLKAISVCVVYGLFDYAISICEAAGEKKVLDEKQYRLAVERLRRPKHLSALLPKFPGRDKIAHALYLLYDVLKTHTWAHSVGALGNDKSLVIRG